MKREQFLSMLSFVSKILAKKLLIKGVIFLLSLVVPCLLIFSPLIGAYLFYIDNKDTIDTIIDLTLLVISSIKEVYDKKKQKPTQQPSLPKGDDEEKVFDFGKDDCNKVELDFDSPKGEEVEINRKNSNKPKN